MGKKDVKANVFLKAKKLPWCDWFVVRGSEIRRAENSRAVRNKVMARILHSNLVLQKRLARYEG